LKPGLSWTYEVEGETTTTVTNKILRTVFFNNTEWYELEEYGKKFWIRNTELGQVEALYFHESTAEEGVVFKFPAKPGESWMIHEDKHVYLGQFEVSVPAGKYRCHMYLINMGSGSYSKSCIAENVGVVFNEFKLKGKKKQISRLVSFRK
jgi:hypothetical protein